MYPFLSYSYMNSCTSSLSFLDNRYTFSFLSTNPSFISIAWSQIFCVGILSDCFLPKTLIYLWNFSGTSFLASVSDFATSSSSSHISYSSTTFFPSITFSFFCFFCFSFSSCFFSASSFASFYFCFCHSSFSCFGLHCLLYSSGHLIIFTSPVFQSISGLWRASHSIPKITIHFCPLIMSISVLFLYP